MISWAYTKGNVSHLVGFNKHMKKIAEILEKENTWRMYVRNQEFKIKGNGCVDPNEYLERLASPIANRHIEDNNSWVLCYQFENGEMWEVFRD